MGIDRDYDSLRQDLWLATDQAYKQALDSFSNKQAALRALANAPTVDDFSREAPVAMVEPRVEPDWTTRNWESEARTVSAILKNYPELHNSRVSYHLIYTTSYIVTTEGTQIRTSRSLAAIEASMGTQAADGMRLSRSPAYVVARVEELPSHEALMADARKMLDTIVALQKAPIVEEEYRGPVLFSADAADDIVASLIGQNLEGRKPQLGRPNRTTGAFATSYKARVLPNFLSIIDDPTMNDFQGKSLIGNYMFDSEGVKAQPVDAIQNGILTNYLIGRQPLRDFPVSNGHGRAAAGMTAGPNPGVLLLKSSEPQSPGDLKKKLMEMVKDQGRPYGYRVETLGQPGNTPRLLYRVYANDGHEELVRGAVGRVRRVRALTTAGFG